MKELLTLSFIFGKIKNEIYFKFVDYNLYSFFSNIMIEEKIIFDEFIFSTEFKLNDYL